MAVQGHKREYTIYAMTKTLSLLAAGMAMFAAAAPGVAQQAAAPAANPLGLPNDVTLLANADPNKRTATAVVNGQVITGTDVDHRVALLVSASTAPIPEAELQRVRMQVLRNLIDETLQIQEARFQEIEVSRAEIDEQYQAVAERSFSQDPKAMDDYLTSIGSSPLSLKRQIHGELAWQRLLQRNVQPFINVSDEEVRERMARLEASRGTEEFRIGEIYISATPDTRDTVMNNMRQIMEQLQQGGNFTAYARQFSEASTAVLGGDLGFVRLAQLPSEIAKAATEMQPGQLVGPVSVPGGFSIVYLIDKRQVLMADPRDAVLSLKQISIGFDPNTPESVVQERVELFSNGVSAIRGCGDAERAAAAMGADIVTNDQIPVRQLPEQLQGLILQLQVGQSTPPFGSIQEGVRVLMVCGRDDPKSENDPSFEDIMADLENERIGKRAQRYLRDLRSDAFIEYN